MTQVHIDPSEVTQNKHTRVHPDTAFVWYPNGFRGLQKLNKRTYFKVLKGGAGHWQEL